MDVSVPARARRLKATPLRLLTILTAQVMVIFLMTALGMALLVIVGKMVYGLRFDGNPFNMLAARAEIFTTGFSLIVGIILYLFGV